MKLPVWIYPIAIPIAIIVLLSGCQSTAPVMLFPPEQLLVAPALKGEVTEPETAEQIFALPQHTRFELLRLISSTDSIEERTTSVLKLILSYAQDGLLYDNAATKTASETIAAGRANCLSLSILAYSMAKELGMTAVFQDVQIPEYWTSELSQTWLNGHVNLRLQHGRALRGAPGFVLLAKDIVVDFDPYSLKQQFPEHAISVNRIVAMFYNNKAAVAFASGNDAQAYRYYQAAIEADAYYAPSWSNLGVLYRTNQMHNLAERSYQQSLTLDPSSTNTLANLAYLHRQRGEIAKAEPLEKRVMAKRRTNPYYHLMLGDEAYKGQSYDTAISHYEKAVALDDKNHEAYFGLARSYYAIQNNQQAASYMLKATRNAPSAYDQQRYRHKLAVLNQLSSAY